MASFLRSRAVQVADHLRLSLSQRRLTEPLPGLRVWSRQLGVSRETLGAALSELEREGWFVVERNGVRLKPGRQLPRRCGNGSGRLVRLLLFGPYHPEIEPHFQRIGLLQESLRRNDIELRWEKCFPSRLRRIARLPSSPNELLILGSVPPVYQKLFLKQESAAMALGEVEPGSPLPFVAIDQAGAVRHATFGLIRRGLTRLVLVHADFATAGVRRAVSGFHLACNEWPNQRIVGQAVATGIDTVSLITNLRRIAEASGPRRGLIVLAPVPIGIVVTALLQHGIRMPHDAEVVALFHAQEAVELHPPPVYYPIPIRAQTRLLTAAAVAYFRTGRLPPTRKMIAVEADKA